MKKEDEIIICKTFVSRVEKILKIQNITKKVFCQSLNISITSFFYWKNGFLPRLVTVVKIAKFLNCSIDYLAGLKD